ncbi:MAG: Flp family type IVb pilin [Desulfuromonadales bacterium]|nr:Flp family type IVb pilin [Desulfuromonadales bacterium]
MSTKVLEKAYTFLRDERGATAVEYAMMLVLIILVSIVAVGALGLATEGSFNKFTTTYDSVTK